MQYSKNYNMNLPELADQFNVKQWNDNTEKIDTQMKTNADAIGAEERRATQKENTLSSAISTETNRAKEKENAINGDLTSHKNNKSNPHGVTTTQIGAVPKERKVNNHPLTSDVTVTKGDVGLGNVSNKTDNQFKQMVFDMMCPVDETVIPQYPDEPDPNTKYNKNGITSTWQDITAQFDGRFFKISTSNVGTTTSESLPNITGDPTSIKSNGDSATSIWDLGTSLRTNSGAFYLDSSDEVGTSTAGISRRHKTIKFDASRSNSVYGRNGGKVQPDNVSIKLWKRIK